MIETFTNQDIQLIKSKIDRAWFSLARTYLPFLLALIIAYYTVKPRATRRTISFSNYDKIYAFVFAFFFIVFLIFFIKDYKKTIAPYKKEIKAGEKKSTIVQVRKYFDPVYKQYLLFHPFKQDTYLIVSEQLFNSITEGQEIELQTGINTGIVLAVKINNELLAEIEEFRF